MLYAAADLGGTNVALALGEASGRLRLSRSIPTQSHLGPESVLERIASEILAMACEAGESPAALGMGVPGLIDFARGATLFLPNLPTQWRGVPVAETLSARLNCPVYLLNDARLAALGEFAFGKGRSVRTMVFFTLGTGIGGGLVIGGRLHLGALGAAGEIGHQTVLPGGPLCGCGNHGCLEALASGPAITAEGVRLVRAGLAPCLHELVAGDAGAITPRHMAQAAQAGEQPVRDALVRAARYLGIGAANLVTALHPDLIVLGGGVAGIGELLFDTVRETVRERVRMFPVDQVRIEPSALGDQAGVLGGIALAGRRDLL